MPSKQRRGLQADKMENLNLVKVTPYCAWPIRKLSKPMTRNCGASAITITLQSTIEVNYFSYLMEYSCMKTLARKRKTKISKICDKYYARAKSWGIPMPMFKKPSLSRTLWTLWSSIPDCIYKTTQYYGIHPRHRKSDPSLNKAVHPYKHRILKNSTCWRNDILLSFGYDPLRCSCCIHGIARFAICYDHRLVSMRERCRRTTLKALCHLWIKRL